MKLQEKLERDKQILASLQAAAYPKAQAMTGMPHTLGISDKVGDLAIEIVDMTEQIRTIEEEIDRKKPDVEIFIQTVEDAQLRTIFRLRFCRCLTWGEIAKVMRGGNTEDGVKSIIYRYLSMKLATP
jgi:hypothetical protein